MAGFVESLRNIWSIVELRKRILYTISLLAVYRLGAYVTLPGVDPSILATTTPSSNSLFGMIDLFVGGAFAKAGIFALGIMPYITVSILIQLMGAVVPYFQKMQREGDEGRRKITQLTRQGTVLITAFQSYAYALQLLGTQREAIVVSEFMFYISTIIVLTAGTIFVMWLGERITENGIGNGISLIITTGILAYLPQNLYNEFTTNTGGNIFIFIIELVIWVALIAGVVFVSQGVRRIPVQYAKRVVGRKQMGGTTQYLPLRVIAAGVMPIIFAQSILFIPTTLALFFPNSPFWQGVARTFGDPTGFWYALTNFILIVFFTYFYTAIAVNPKDMSDNMKRQGGFIPGIRPGKQTSDFIDNILTRVTLPGAIFLGVISVLPVLASVAGIDAGWAQFFGGTSLLITVQVVLDTLQQIESHLLMRRYDGFMRSGRLRGRS